MEKSWCLHVSSLSLCRMFSSHIRHIHSWSQCWMAEGEDPSRVPTSCSPSCLGTLSAQSPFSPRHHSHLAHHHSCPTSGPIQLAPDPSFLPSCPSLAFSVSDTGTNLHSSSRTRSPVLIFPSNLGRSTSHQPWSYANLLPKYFWTPLPSVPAFASHGLNYLRDSYSASVCWELVNNAFLRCPSDSSYVSTPSEFFSPFKAN